MHKCEIFVKTRIKSYVKIYEKDVRKPYMSENERYVKHIRARENMRIV